jgi:hypothetical protein
MRDRDAPGVRVATSRAKRASASPWMEVAGYSSAMLHVIVRARAAPAVATTSTSAATAYRAVDLDILIIGLIMGSCPAPAEDSALDARGPPEVGSRPCAPS